MKRALGVAASVAALLAAREASAACQGRPTDAGGALGYTYGTDAVQSFDGTRVRVHYAMTGANAVATKSTRSDDVPDTVAYAAARGDEALSAYAGMGYNAIPSDATCASNGGDGKVDIYLMKLGAADGRTVAECPGDEAPGVCSSFVLVESTFLGRGYESIEAGFSTVVTHELFHAEQNTYRLNDGGSWAEGTAQWAMHAVHPELEDFERQLPAFFSDPTRSIDSPPAGSAVTYLYGSSVWPLFLSLRHGNDVIHDVFVAEASGADDTMTTIEAVLEAKSSSLAAEFPLFGAWNVGTGSFASTGGYPDAATYPGEKPGALRDGVNGITSGFGTFTYRGTLTIPQQISLDTEPTRNAGILVPVENGTLQLGKAAPLPATATGDVVVIVSGVTEKKTDAPFTVHIGDVPVAATPDGGVSAGTPANVVTTESGGCAAASAPDSTGYRGGILGATMIALALLGLRSRRKS